MKTARKKMNDACKRNKQDIFGILILTGLIIILAIILSGVIYAAESDITASVEVLRRFIIIHSPVDEEWYNAKKLMLNISLSEKVKYLYYKINTNSYTRLCSNCNRYVKKKAFVQGQDNLKIRAQKYDNLIEYSSITFNIDSIKPKIKGIYPSSYGRGLFSVRYTEANLKNVTLHYWWNLSEVKKEQLSCESGTHNLCSHYVNLSDYNGKYIYYKFELKDNFFSVNSSARKILVDTINPIMNVYSPKNNTVYTNKYGYVYLSITLNEKSKLQYDDNNFARVTLCSKCLSWKRNKKFSFGQHNVTFKASDLAGNTDEEEVSFVLKQY